MTASAAATGAILLRIGDHDAHELATFEVPLTINTTYARDAVTVQIGDWRAEVVAALRGAADLVESGRADPDRDDAAQ
jgi:hypothetical protein